MDAIKSVEAEVDKVLRLFSSCKNKCNEKIDELIGLIERSKQEIDRLSTPGQNELNSLQTLLVKDICDNVQKMCSQLTNSHRELHVPVSKIGKSIDKNFNAEFGCGTDTQLFQSPENKALLNRAIVQHFLRHGMRSVAQELIKEANLKVDHQELMLFDEIDSIVDSVRKKDIDPALKWAIKNRDRLRQLNSPLEINIHRIKMIDLYKQGVTRQHDIIKYARDNLQPLNMYELDIQHLMGAMLYLKTGIENSPYKSLLDPIDYDEIGEIFVSNACALLNMSIKCPMSVVMDAGCIALPAILKINHKLNTPGLQEIWPTRDDLPVGLNLGWDLQFHSTITCQVLRQFSTDNNPPMRLVCGHILSKDGLQKLCSSTQNKLKCPHCQTDQLGNDAKQIYF